MIGHLDGKIVIGRLLENEKNIDKVLEALLYPGNIKNLSRSQKLDALRAQAEHCIKVNPNLKFLTAKDVIVVYAWDELRHSSKREAERIFGHVKGEKKLKLPMAMYFRDKGYNVFEEVRISKSQADLLAFPSSGWSPETIGIELKTEVAQLRRALDQLTDYRVGVDKCYLGTTAYCVIDYIRASCTRGSIKADILKEKLESIGVGLFTIDYTSGGIYEIFSPYYRGNRNNELYNQIREDCKNKRLKPFQFKPLLKEKEWKDEQEKLRNRKWEYF